MRLRSAIRVLGSSQTLEKSLASSGGRCNPPTAVRIARPRMYESPPRLETPLHSHSRPFKCGVTFSAGCSGLPGGPPYGSRTESAAEVLVLLGLDILT